MGGGIWRDNFDGTYTQLDDDYYLPAAGWSYLDLYLMGLISPAEVSDFFIVRNLGSRGDRREWARGFQGRPNEGDDSGGRYRGGPAVTRRRQIAAGVQHRNGDCRSARRKTKLVERAEGIRKQWMDYFSITTGHRAHRASMTANPR